MSHARPVKVRLHFTLGPVQGFVGESRRTRDLWGSSFMLSYLVVHALAAVRARNGELVLPDVENDGLLAWIEGRGGELPPAVGSVPNRFTVEFTAVDGEDDQRLHRRAGDAACAGKAAVGKAWRSAAEAVRERFFPAAILGAGKESASIWNRQIEHFWDVAWILTSGEDLEDFSALDVRKNWRTKDYAPEAGDKCSIMTGWQELSGYVRSWPEEQKAQLAFWDRVMQQAGSNLDVQKGERLCAIAAVKRLYPRVAALKTRAALQGGGDGAALADGQVNWPSTRYMASVPWLARVLGQHVRAADAFLEALDAADVRCTDAERNTKIASLAGFTHRLRFLDSNLYDRRSLSNSRVTGLDRRRSEAALAAAERLYREVGGPPSSYYALLLMDGDSMGKVLRVFGEEGKIGAPTRALGRFGRGVGEIVRGHNGVTVYAGGDDVLALLPLSNALGCALALEASYRDAFGEACDRLPAGRREDAPATISASLLFADAQLPLRFVLAEAHHLLDGVAKEANGRSSIAVALWKPSGMTARWATTWGHLRSAGGAGGEGGEHALGRLGRYLVAGDGQGDGRDERALISSSLLYRLREQFSQLFDTTLDVPGAVGSLPAEGGGEFVGTLMTALLLQSQEVTGAADVEACRTAVQRVREVCQQRRHRPLLAHEAPPDRTFTFDALILARFLARDGQEEA